MPCLCRLAIGELLVPQYFGSKIFFDHYTYEKESLLQDRVPVNALLDDHPRAIEILPS
ncbi:hypothetical protein EMIT0158MI4_120086 [Burkholderia ambifaria]